jgi:transcriptional regulator with XRE-family HTH domain
MIRSEPWNMPVYSSHLLQYDELKLGDRIREARQQQGITLRELADKLETSSARLSQIENDRLRLDLHEVLAFAAALNVPLDSLVPADAALPYHIERDADVRAHPARPTLLASPRTGGEIASPHSFWPLADLFVGRHLEPVLGRIGTMDEASLRFCYHDEEEFTFTLRGTLEFRIKTPAGERREELSRGDCVYFRSDLPHCFRSLEKEPAESLHVFCSPSASVGTGFERSSFRAIAYDGNGPGDPRQQIGERLRLLRDIHGWSLERVARSAGVTERQLQRIERGERPMPLEAMLKLARAVGKPLRELIGLAPAREPYYVVQRSGEIPSIPSRKRRTRVERPSAPASKTCQPLVPGFPARDMYPYLLRMLNVELDTLTHHEHHGQEFIYVLEGELELMTYSKGEDVREVIRAGDSCYMDSTVPHLIRSWTRNPYSETSAEVIDVFWCSLGEAYLFEM